MAIIANNDLKYEANKVRAAQDAACENAATTYCHAKYVVTADALRERPDLPAQENAVVATPRSRVR